MPAKHPGTHRRNPCAASSPEEAPDVQPSSVFGVSDGEPQAPRFLPEDAEPRETAERLSTETLCLSRTGLQRVSDSILENTTLVYLNMEGNQLSDIPDALFLSLPHLQWLDLRNNLLAALPAEIGSHRSLKTLLLEGNPITALPPELGNVITLQGLNIRKCPITFPPQHIVDRGVKGILQYLRSVMAARQVSVTKDAPPELPVLEKLQLSELMGSSTDEQDEDELQKFQELKHKMILLDRAELGSIRDRNPQSCLCPITKSKKATTRASGIPELHLLDSQNRKRLEERRHAAEKEMNEEQAILQQRRTSQEALRKWQAQAKIKQHKKMSEYLQKKKERQKKKEEANGDTKPCVEVCSETLKMPEASLAQELEWQIRARAERIQERHTNPRGTNSEQMAAAEQDVLEMTTLRRQLLERNRNRGRDRGKCFTIFTGDARSSFGDP